MGYKAMTIFQQCSLFSGDYVRIVCPPCNAFSQPLATSLESDAVIARRTMALAKSASKLQQKATDNNKWDKKRTIWKTMDVSKMPDLPHYMKQKLGM